MFRHRNGQAQNSNGNRGNSEAENAPPISRPCPHKIDLSLSVDDMDAWDEVSIFHIYTETTIHISVLSLLDEEHGFVWMRISVFQTRHDFRFN